MDSAPDRPASSRSVARARAVVGTALVSFRSCGRWCCPTCTVGRGDRGRVRPCGRRVDPTLRPLSSPSLSPVVVARRRGGPGFDGRGRGVAEHGGRGVAGDRRRGRLDGGRRVVGDRGGRVVSSVVDVSSASERTACVLTNRACAARRARARVRVRIQNRDHWSRRQRRRLRARRHKLAAAVTIVLRVPRIVDS